MKHKTFLYIMQKVLQAKFGGVTVHQGFNTTAIKHH